MPSGFVADLGELSSLQWGDKQGTAIESQILVKWANEMEKYQKRIMKNYFPALTMATTRKSNNKKETKMIKMEEKEKKKQDVKIEAVSIELKKIK